MEALNRAIGDAAIFKDMLQKVTRNEVVQTVQSPEIIEWNARVERERADKFARKIKSAEAAHIAAVLQARDRA